MPGIGIGISPFLNRKTGIDYSSYWATLISATVENAAPTHVVLTFLTAQTSLTDTDFTIAGFTVSSASWTDAVLTLVLSEAVLVFDGDLTVTFGKTSETATVTNNVANDGNTIGDYDFTDLTTITKDGSDLISQINDLSGNNNNLTAATTARPTYTSDGVVFNGSANVMKTGAITLNQPVQAYLVVKQISLYANDFFLDGNNFGYCGIRQINATPPSIDAYAGTGSDDAAVTVGSYHIIRAIFNGANSKLQIDKNTPITGDFGTRNAGMITIGAGGNSSGFANVAYKRAILRKVDDSDETEEKIYTSLRRKYATKSLNIIAVVGQSNALGVYPEDILPDGYEGAQDNIYISWDGAALAKMNPGTNTGLATQWGAEQSCSHELLNDCDRVIVVKDGENGRPIDDWGEGGTHYIKLLAGLTYALNHLNAEYADAVNLSLLWVQGEFEASAGVETAVYEPKLRDLITRLRAADTRLADIQFVLRTLSTIQTIYSTANKAKINAAFTNIAVDTDNVIVLNTDNIVGLAVNADNIHYTAASQLLLGSAWKALI